MSNKPKNSAVWFEIPVTDMAKSMAFYGTVLGTTLVQDDSGPNPMAVFPLADMTAGVSGHLCPGKPCPEGGNTIHLVVSKLSEAVERVPGAGGQVVSEPITIPPGRFVYCKDPDGNSIGLFEFAK